MKRITSTIITLLLIASPSFGQSRIYADFKPVGDSLKVLLQKRTSVRSGLRVEKVMKRGDIIDFYFSPELSDYPWTEPDIKWFKSELRRLTPSAYKKYAQGEVFGRGFALDDLITPPLYSDGKAHKSSIRVYDRRTKAPLVRPADGTWFSKGLSGRHIALWQSHGRYYETKTSRWEWQRAALHRTVEDMYTQSYVLPFLIPMLENAGAYVLTPRERDTQSREIICDNDPSFSGDRYADMRKAGLYSEKGSWKDAGVGFADGKAIYSGYDNPFTMGTARSSECAEKAGAHATWTPDIPERGFYAVYVSYKTLSNSSSAVNYTVHHLGGQSKFIVNQKMGGGMWVYLGTFEFEKGTSGCVVLDNGTPEGHKFTKGAVVTADAVRFGGGVGKIARGDADEDISRYTTSGLPCFTEGALYSMQFGGLDMTLFDEWDNDYTKDYAGRGAWVSHLSGGSWANPGKPGRAIPFDLSLAFHSDAGTTPNDSIVGTLSIYTSLCEGKSVLPDGEKRFNGRVLAASVQNQIIRDVRKEFEPKWSRRQLWDRSYSESRTPSVPAMLLELLSHQNLADMKYGLDPTFRFTVSRAIYKGMLKYLSDRYGCPYEVQPLPVESFSATMDGALAKLSWVPASDPLEPTAKPEGYILYTRMDDGAFNNGIVLTDFTEKDGRVFVDVKINPGHLFSFRVVAFNEGGKSFPSEVLTVGVPTGSKGSVLVVNNFDRVSAPAWFDTPTYAGFVDNLDSGVPYGSEINYIGEVFDFNRMAPWTDDDNPGFGGSYSDMAGKLVAGNTFDFVYSHAKAFFDNGYSVSSSSASAFDGEKGLFTTLDLICGKQVTTLIGRGAVENRYPVFPSALRSSIEKFSRSGGNILVSGSYIATDVWDHVYSIDYDKADREAAQAFVKNVLGYKWLTNFGTRSEKVLPKKNSLIQMESPVFYNRSFSPSFYRVENPDGISPATESAEAFMLYSDSNIPAATAYTASDHKAVAFGFPLETVKNEDERSALVAKAMEFFEKR